MATRKNSRPERQTLITSRIIAYEQMATDNQNALANAKVDEFLARHETGVLSLAREDKPYSIPVSYGYDADTRTFYLRLVSAPESEKRKFLTSSPQARLVVYREDGDTYRSVVAVGTLEEIDRDELTLEHLEQYGETKQPLFALWGQSKRDVDIRLYRIDPDDITGRKVEIDREAGS